MSSKKDMIEVQVAPGAAPIRHGDADGVVEYTEGERFSVSRHQAEQLFEAGAIVKPGTKASATSKEEKEAAKRHAEIDEANAKAEAERQANADKKAPSA